MSRKIKYGYKVVSLDLTSVKFGIASVHYRIGHWTMPKKGCGPLAVFSTEEDARELCRAIDNPRYSCLYIYRCKYYESKKRYLYDTVCKMTSFGYHIKCVQRMQFATRVMLLEAII